MQSVLLHARLMMVRQYRNG